MRKLIGNEKTYETLTAMLAGNRLSHALLVEGPAGCGKLTFAGEIAQAAVCSAPTPEGPCGVCRDCVKAEKGVHPDILTYSGGGGSRSFHIDTVRELRQEAFVRPNEAESKVILLRNAHEMSVQAQNALLKIIEEPPKNVRFLLTCENRFQMLETILSRVQVLTLSVPTVSACAAYLDTALPDTDPQRRRQAAQLAGGNVGRATALLEQEENPADSLAAKILYDACIGSELDALAALAKYERDRPGLLILLEQMAGALREQLLRPQKENPLGELVTRAGQLRLLKILAIIEDTAQAVSQNVGGLLLVTSLCARIRSVLAGV